MSGRDISFSTSTEPARSRYLDDNPVWGVADESPGTETDADREGPVDLLHRQRLRPGWPLRSRLREQKSIEAHARAGRLPRRPSRIAQGRDRGHAGLAPVPRERDAVDRWRQRCHRIAAAPDRRRPGAAVLGPDDRTRIGGVAKGTCDGARLEGAYADSQRLFQDLIGEANRRAPASTPSTPPASAPRRVRTRRRRARGGGRSRATGSASRIRRALDSIRTLGESTNGMALVDSNDFSGSPPPRRRRLQLLLPARLHVDQRQAGREVPQDQGDREAARRAGPGPRRLPGAARRRTSRQHLDATPRAARAHERRIRRDAQLTAALGRLTPSRPGVPLVVSAAAGVVAGGTTRSIRVTAELDSAIAATPEWADGGEAQAFVRDAKGDTVTTGKAVAGRRARGRSRSKCRSWRAWPAT